MSEADMYKRHGARFRARKRAVTLLFEAELRDLDVVELALERQKMGEQSQEFHDVAPYTVDIVTGVAERLERLDDMISEHLREWTLDRLPAVDRAILRAGAWEVLYGDDDVDTATAIDQAVLLATEFSNDNSIAYINAVLDRIAGLAEHILAAERAVSALERKQAATDQQPTDDTAPEDTAPSGTEVADRTDDSDPTVSGNSTVTTETGSNVDNTDNPSEPPTGT